MLSYSSSLYVQKAENIMLQDAAEDAICKMSESTGRDVPMIDIGTLQHGSVVQVTTESRSVYLIEIIHERSVWVYFTRYTHKNERKTGRFFGRQRLQSPILTVGETFTHDDMTTKPITKITLLCE